VAALVTSALVGRADSASVSVVFGNPAAMVGQTVDRPTTVTGLRDAQAPEEISIKGLEIHATGQSREFEMRNFATSSSVTYTYTVLPLRAGRFTIPSQTVQAGGRVIRTPQLVLNVADSPGQPTTTRPNRGG